MLFSKTVRTTNNYCILYSAFARLGEIRSHAWRLLFPVLVFQNFFASSIGIKLVGLMLILRHINMFENG